jgi:hypothetical protein
VTPDLLMLLVRVVLLRSCRAERARIPARARASGDLLVGAIAHGSLIASSSARVTASAMAARIASALFVNPRNAAYPSSA